jgi:3-dehydroquinate dehydratase-1
MILDKKRPLIALPLDDADLKEKLKVAKDKPIDIIELRIDQFSSFDTSYILDLASLVKENGFYLLATVRSKEEGGADLPDEKRLNIFSEVVKLADILDIELTSQINKDVIKLAKENGKLSLVSYHDFEKTPLEKEIQEIIDKSASLGADIIKYAFKTNSVEDVGRILSVSHKNRDKNIVAIGMGETGKITRVAGFFFGSLITYTFIGKSFAPGQIEVDKLVEEMKFYNLM